MFDYFAVLGRQVEVDADGVLYRGKLVEMTENDIHLESSSGWMVIALEKVTDVRPVDEEV